MLYDRGDCVADYDDNNDMERYYVTPYDGENLMVFDNGCGSDHFYSLDAKGSVTNIYNTNQTAVNSYTYAGYGSGVNSTSGIYNRFRFMGGELDEETQIVDNEEIVISESLYHYSNNITYDPSTSVNYCFNNSFWKKLTLNFRLTLVQKVIAAFEKYRESLYKKQDDLINDKFEFIDNMSIILDEINVKIENARIDYNNNPRIKKLEDESELLSKQILGLFMALYSEISNIKNYLRNIANIFVKSLFGIKTEVWGFKAYIECIIITFLSLQDIRNEIREIWLMQKLKDLELEKLAEPIKNLEDEYKDNWNEFLKGQEDYDKDIEETNNKIEETKQRLDKLYDEESKIEDEF